MNIISFLLDSENKTVLKGKSAGERIKARNKSHLWEDRTSSLIDTVVIHYISARDFLPLDPFNKEAILSIFPDCIVSSHYCIFRQGTIFRLVPEDKKAWHCGGSIMPEPDNRQNVNEFSLGIELVATHESGFTDEQYKSLTALCRDIETRFHIQQYVGHENIAGQRAVAKGLRKDLKTDPGPLFDWQRFHAMKGMAASIQKKKDESSGIV